MHSQTAPEEHVSISRAISREIDLPGARLRLLPRAAYRAAFTPTHLVIGFAFDIQRGSHAFASDRRVPFVTRPATTALTPPGCEVYSTSDTGGEYLTLEIATPEALGLSDPARGDVPEAAQSNLLAPQAGPAARRLRAGLLSGETSGLAAAEAALNLAEATLQAAGAQTVTVQRGGASLTDRRLRQLDELIESRLGGRLTIAEMAEALGLRPRFFLRAFRAATGTTPHAYLLERRLEAARRRLAIKDQTIATVAAAAGFASQAHLVSAFRRAFGLTPSAYRRAFA